MPAQGKRKDGADAAFFAALERGATVVAAARLAGCSRQALYRRRIVDFAFGARWRAVEQARRKARRAAIERLRRRLVARAQKEWPPTATTWSRRLMALRLPRGN
jgi:hypothetical protein